ncbi:hypothetical protein B1H19_01425 [Streptomyces gilvosporeus]|uniref:Uncharacterized protein n=1 Tax=Streptomyces gilvosporeus TaxID=553510 RepID=A0A1V0TJF4_9ACTN|nr:hypothetical protein B1H19_01425 [Streptomyces gilvosporeus]
MRNDLDTVAHGLTALSGRTTATAVLQRPCNESSPFGMSLKENRPALSGNCVDHLPVNPPSPKTRWRTTATTATFPEAVRETEEVVPVNAVSTWVLPSGATVGR